MRLAWFRHTSLAAATPLDETAPCIRALGHTHEIAVVTAETARGFAETHARQPYDLCVYELLDRPWRSDMHEHALHHPGLALTPAEWPRGWGQAGEIVAPPRPTPDAAVRFGIIGGHELAPLHRAAARAGELGTPLELMFGDPFDVVDRADVVVSLTSPSRGESLMPALAALAAAKPVVVYEVEATAVWPACDPQTWAPRGPAPRGAPIVVSIDLRDEEHSLLLALRRLHDDAALRAQLGAAGHAWWRDHGTVAHAAAAWEGLLTAAMANRG